MAQEKQKLKPYKEVLDKVLYSKDYETESNGKVYPTNRVKVELVDYSWENEIKWEVKPYEWQKVKITNSKLESEDWQNVIKKKVQKTQYWDKIVDDESVVRLSPDEFTELLKHFSKKTETA